MWPVRAAADLLVGRVRRVAAGVADRGRVDAGQLPEEPLGAPEAAHARRRRLESLRERRLERRAEHVVAAGHRASAVLAAGQRALGLDHLRLLTEQEHDHRVCPRAYAAVTRFTLVRWTPGATRGSRRGGRVAEGTRLLSEYGAASSIAGSNPALSAGLRLHSPPLSAPVAQLDRASVYGTEGQRFESSRARYCWQAGCPCIEALFRHSKRADGSVNTPEGVAQGRSNTAAPPPVPLAALPSPLWPDDRQCSEASELP